jgi:hypothetical protein
MIYITREELTLYSTGMYIISAFLTLHKSRNIIKLFQNTKVSTFAIIRLREKAFFAHERII